MATELSEKQRRILGAIGGFIDRYGYPPSHRDLMRWADISSTSVVAYNLHILRDHGLVELPDDRSRALRLIGPNIRYEIMVPLIGEMRPERLLPAYTGEAEPAAPEPAAEPETAAEAEGERPDYLAQAADASAVGDEISARAAAAREAGAAGDDDV